MEYIPSDQVFVEGEKNSCGVVDVSCSGLYTLVKPNGEIIKARQDKIRPHKKAEKLTVFDIHYPKTSRHVASFRKFWKENTPQEIKERDIPSSAKTWAKDCMEKLWVYLQTERENDRLPKR